VFELGDGLSTAAVLHESESTVGSARVYVEIAREASTCATTCPHGAERRVRVGERREGALVAITRLQYYLQASLGLATR